MGKKGSWFSAIKKVFTSSSKEKPVNEGEKKSGKEKKVGRGLSRLKNGSFIPLFKEPSSIEKILEEIDQQNQNLNRNLYNHQSDAQPSRPLSPTPRITSPPRVTSPPRIRAAANSPPRIRPAANSPPRIRAAANSPPRISPPTVVANRQTEISQRPEPTLQQQHVSATKIQAVYRGYMARRKVRGLTGLVRLQEVVKGQHVKRQTVNAMRRMQLLVRVQTQIQSRRIQMLENQALKHQSDNKQANTLLNADDENWDDSLLTKEEKEARMQKKVEAMIKREKAMAYAYSHQLWKGTPKSVATDNRSGGYPNPWWWKWLDRQLPCDNQSTPDRKRAPSPSTSVSVSTSKTRQKQQMITTPPSVTTTNLMKKYSMNKARGRGGVLSSSTSNSPYPMKDDDSLMSCPPAFSVPSYMSPTASARAKARPTTSASRAPSTPGSERRFSFPFTPNSNNGSVSGSFKGSGNKHVSPRSVGDFSVDSAFSVGRKPFNRFV